MSRNNEPLSLELKIISATDVSHRNVIHTDKMNVYAVVSINGDDSQQQSAKTPIDYDGGSNPTWNHAAKFTVKEKAARDGQLTVNVKLYNYWLEGANDLEIGEVNVSVQELLVSNPLPPSINGNGDKMKLMTYPMKVTGGGTKATLSLSYRFKPESISSQSFRRPSLYPTVETGTSSQAIANPQQCQTVMTKLTLDLVIKSANDIENISLFNGMDLYASVSIREGETTIKHRACTPVIFSVYKTSYWDHPIQFSLDEHLVREGRLRLVVQLICQRTIRGDMEIGEVNVPILKILESNPPSTLSHEMKLETQDVRDSLEKKGTLSFMYRFLMNHPMSPPTTPPATYSAAPPGPPATTPQPCFVYIPVPADPTQGSSSGYGAVYPGGYVGLNNGPLPFHMMPPPYGPYQTHGYQHYYPPHPQRPPHDPAA